MMENFVTAEDREKVQQLLSSDEEILWCGKPVLPGFFNGCSLIGGGWSVAILGFAVHAHGQGQLHGSLLIMCALFFCVGVLIATLGSLFVIKEKRKTIYVLTPQRALVVSAASLRSYPVEPYMVLAVRLRRKRCDIVFEQERDDESVTERGFIDIRDGEHVLALLSELLPGKTLCSEMPPDVRKERLEHERAERLALAATHLRSYALLTAASALALAASVAYAIFGDDSTEFPTFCIMVSALFTLCCAGALLAAIRGRNLKPGKRD